MPGNRFQARIFRHTRHARAAAGKRLRLGAAVAAVVIVVAAAAAIATQLLRSVPTPTVTASPLTLRVLPGPSPHPRWPAGAQAAIGVAGAGMLASHGGDQPQPIASVAKMMTAYLVLRDHPLPVGGTGPLIKVTSADAATYVSDKRQGQSVVAVKTGERLSERQALEAMLIPSGNNIATMLARWDSGSARAFVARMNAQARAMGLARTRYADASGDSPATVSTAADQLNLAMRALTIPAFRHTVAMPQVTLPVAGLAYNVNSALGHDGIDGVKTGSTSQAGGCLVFSAPRTVAGRKVTIVGVVLGMQPTRAQPSMLAGVMSASEALLTSVSGDLEQVRLVAPGAVLGHVHSAWSPGPAMVAASSLNVIGWPGMPVSITLGHPLLPVSMSQGQPVAWARVAIGGDVRRLRLDASQRMRPPSLHWRLTRF